MINWAQVDELKSDMADAFDEIVEVFLQEVDEGVDKLNGTKPVSTMAADLHFLKGAALNLGFADFAALCSVGEASANNGKSDQVDLDALRACYRKSRLEFVTGLKRRAA
jgi:HPt (histidine-containing phosphotransfer) domain-containing protein